jgi:lipoprotein signal peptidase
MTETNPARRPQMLPGIAAICLYLIVMTTTNVYAALTGVYGHGPAKYGSLALCSLLAIGIFGLLRQRKWGWALVTAACLLTATGYFYFFARTHAGFLVIQGLFGLIFFLYLIRQETRERLV